MQRVTSSTVTDAFEDGVVAAVSWMMGSCELQSRDEMEVRVPHCYNKLDFPAALP
jgi:hypothetical protein